MRVWLVGVPMQHTTELLDAISQSVQTNMDSATFPARVIAPIVLSLLSACTKHRCLAFVSPRLAPGVLSSWDDVPSAVASLLCRGNSFPTRHQRRQRSLLRTAAEGDDGGAGVNGGSGGGDAKAGTGAGAGMDLDGEWQVKSGEVSACCS